MLLHLSFTPSLKFIGNDFYLDSFPKPFFASCWTSLEQAWEKILFSLQHERRRNRKKVSGKQQIFQKNSKKSEKVLFAPAPHLPTNMFSNWQPTNPFSLSLFFVPSRFVLSFATNSWSYFKIASCMKQEKENLFASCPTFVWSFFLFSTSLRSTE